MSIEALRGILDQLAEASWVSGTATASERLALALPDGDVGAADDAGFVPWLLEHSEPAPYGDGGETKLDPKVRNAKRATARGAIAVHGFDPVAILGTIEATLSPGWHLEARLTDVVAYPKGGKFERHKDTPREKSLIGTLVVGLPIAHTGGEFHVDDGRKPAVFDWSKTAKGQALPWVALFSDVDHEIKPVKSGTRVTLVYALHRTDRPRNDAAWTKRQTAIQQACAKLKPPAWPLMIACGRHAIAEPETKQPQGIETLRGADRDIADALVAAGYTVGVRACIAAVGAYGDAVPITTGEFPTHEYMWAVHRLKAVPPLAVFEGLNDEGTAFEIEPYMHDSVLLTQWLVRKNALALLAHENAMWSEEGGYAGNEGFDAILYTLAAIEVTQKKGAAAKKPAAKKPAAKKPAAKKSPPKNTKKQPSKKPSKR